MSSRSSDEEIIAATRQLWQALKLVVEVSSATVFAAVIKQRERFAGKQVGLVLTGGNVDLMRCPGSNASSTLELAYEEAAIIRNFMHKLRHKRWGSLCA